MLKTTFVKSISVLVLLMAAVITLHAQEITPNCKRPHARSSQHGKQQDNLVIQIKDDKVVDGSGRIVGQINKQETPKGKNNVSAMRRDAMEFKVDSRSRQDDYNYKHPSSFVSAIKK